MKTFTCRELGGPCDEQLSGETHQEVGEKGGAHIMGSTDEAHAPLREQLASTTEEDKEKWWTWFKGEWDKKEEN